MDPERWQQIRPILESALELNATSRKTFLDGVCADAALRSEVESLLLSHDAAPSGVLRPEAPPLLKEEAEETLRLPAGKLLGAYEIVGKIADGGMGAVYRARRADGQYQQEVALKIVRVDLATESAAARFKNERQILASLDHPNIAKILDGGTTSEGVPYFVMDLIEGLPITAYCDAQKLSVDERLKVFRAVCAAVHYAHQHLVIHRDLKPTNILVTSEGVPKLLDFGIAKILDPDMAPESAMLTSGGGWPMTPEYASPEQLCGEKITTATDVYSLGLVLYELLSGRRAHQFASRLPHEMARSVLDGPPEKPSAAIVRRAQRANDFIGKTTATPEPPRELRGDSLKKLQRRLTGDLDNIVMKALRREPQERYNSADQLSEDLRRHSEGLPVLARPDTLSYRTLKFISRHRFGVGAAAAMLVVVVAGLAATLYEAHVARVERARAEARFNDVRSLASSLMFDVHDSIEDLPGSTPARKQLVERALRYLDSLSRDAASDAALQRELATAFEKVGTVQGNPFGANLGDSAGALDSYQKSLAIRKSLVNANPHNFEDRLGLAHGEELVADVLSNRFGPNGLAEAEAALATAEQSLEAAPGNENALRQVRADNGLVALILQCSVGDYEGAKAHWQKKKSIEEALLRANPGDRNLPGILVLTELYIATNLARLGSRKEALQYFAPPHIASDADLVVMGVEAKRVNAWAHGQAGDILLMNHDRKEAAKRYRKQSRILESLSGADPANMVLDYDLATAYANLGNALALGGQPAEGMELLGRATQMFQKQIAHDPAYLEPRWALGRSELWLDEALARTGDPSRARNNLGRELSDWEALARYSPLAAVIVGEIHSSMGSLARKLGDAGEAGREYQRALELLEPVATTQPSIIEAHYALADLYFGLGELSGLRAADTRRDARLRSDDWTEARTFFERSLSKWQEIPNAAARTPAGFACGNPKEVARRLAELPKHQVH
jgi:serine/threonine protein kinase